MAVESLKSCDFRIVCGPSDDRVRDFLVPALSLSVSYDCMIGKFSASALADATDGLSPLIRNGGSMRILAGFAFDEADLSVVRNKRELSGILIGRLTPLFDIEDPVIRRKLEILAWMAAHEKLQIRLLLPRKNGKILSAQRTGGGIVPKTGIFTDGEGRKVSMLAWLNTAEHFFVFKSWDESAPYLEAVGRHFEELWEGREPGWLTLPLPSVLADRLVQLRPLKSPVRDALENVALVRPEIDPTLREKLFFQFLRDFNRLPGGPAYPPASELETVLTGSGTLKACWERHPEIHDAWILRWQGKRIAVTFYREIFDRHPETLSLLSFGDSLLNALLQGIAALKAPESCQIPLVRFAAEAPVPVAAYYDLGAEEIRPVTTLAELASAADAKMRAGGPSVVAEARAREHFNALVRNQLKARTQSRQVLQRTALRKLEEKGKSILVRSALCDIARSRHATLFDQNLIAAGFDEQTILRQGEKSQSLAELLSFVHTGGIKPVISDPFWTEVDGKPEKTIRSAEDVLLKEARELLRAMAELRDKPLEGDKAPAIERSGFYRQPQREKQPLMLAVAPPKKERFTRYLPFYTIATAAEKFGSGGVVKEEGWMEAAMDHKPKKTMFVTQIQGRSMAPVMAEGSLAVFDSDVPAVPDGLILMVMNRGIDDPDLGEGVTIRRCHFSKRIGTGKIFRYPEILLEPENPEYETILLKDVASGDLRIIGKYVGGI